MKKVIYLTIMFLMISLTVSAQASGGQITRKKANTTTAAPKKTTPTPKKTTAAAKTYSSGKPRSSTAGMSQAQKERIIQNLINNMVYVEGGTFMMGATSEQGSDADSDENPIHQVTLSSFSIGRYEVTQEEWQAVMGSNPAEFRGSKRPVENVSWNDCQEFIRKLNAMTGKQFRLPSEAEWEYAARGGNRSRGYKYAGSNDLSSVAWHDDNSGGQTHEVGSKQPNELGLFDISGNVWEWCQDWYGGYSSSSQTNPTGPSSGSIRVFRGGCWGGNARLCRVSDRSSFPDHRSYNLGLRLAQ